MSSVALRVDGVSIELVDGRTIVDDVSFSVRAGEVLGLVGESGSGKTTLALALLGYARAGCRIASGTVEVDGTALTGVTESVARSQRGRIVSYVPQDPASSLNPSLRVGDAIGDMLGGGRDDEAVLDALRRVELPADASFARRYPHELSGGQQQRVAIATALVRQPAAVVMDEPTTGLDVVTQARILEEIERLRANEGIAVVYVSHDLAVVGSIADRIAVMYAGRIVESGPATAILTRPRHPYTLGLVASIPDHVTRRPVKGIGGVAAGVGDRPAGCSFSPRCAQRTPRCELEQPPPFAVAGAHDVRCFEWRETPPLAHFPAANAGVGPARTPLLDVSGLTAAYGDVVVVDEVSFELGEGECLALVGESGSGKTTVARCVAGLHTPLAGTIQLRGSALAGSARKRSRDERRRLQIVFQNPYDSLNPRRRIGDEIARPAELLRGLSRADARARVDELLDRVRLPARVARRFPSELSGGERQRVAIARALAADPDVVVCDEVTSALDVSVQAAVLELLAELRGELGVSLLFITHDLGVVGTIADRVLVLEHGRMLEAGTTTRVLDEPEADYTRRLLAAAPRLPAPDA